MKWLKLIGGALGVAVAVVLLPEVLGPGPRADFAVGEKLATGALAIPLALIFAGGVLTAMTPCVYPLIPITVSVFGARKASSRGKSFALTGVYVLGISVMFTSLGIAAALTGKAFGSVLGNPYVVVGIALLFAAFAASMFGAWDLQLPSSLQTRLGTVGKAGFAGAFGMGLVAGVVAAPCTGPVLSGVLMHVATTQDVPVGAALLFSYSLGLGLPFFLIGAFSLNMPKGGPWMNGVKSIFGIALLVLAVLYLRDAFPGLRMLLTLDTVAYGALLAAGLVFLGIALGAVHRSFHSWPAEGLLKAVGVALVVVGLSLRPGAPLATPALVASANWLTNESKAVVQGAALERPILIDFYADWCSACKDLDKYVYTHPTFTEEARRFLLVKVDGTRESPEVEALYRKYKVDGLPTVIFVDGTGKVRQDLTVKGYLPPREFVKLMSQVR